MYWIGEVEEKVIELDSDGDGLVDRLDTICPNSPEGEDTFQFGCTRTEWGLYTDGDSDGVLNGEDKCIETKAGAEVNEDGCSEEDLEGVRDPNDIDNDGVDNVIDKCPGTIEGAENIDLNNGCSEEQFNNADFDSDGIKNADEGSTSNGESCVELSGKHFSNGCPLEASHKNLSLIHI